MKLGGDIRTGPLLPVDWTVAFVGQAIEQLGSRTVLVEYDKKGFEGMNAMWQ